MKYFWRWVFFAMFFNFFYCFASLVALNKEPPFLLLFSCNTYKREIKIEHQTLFSFSASPYQLLLHRLWNRNIEVNVDDETSTGQVFPNTSYTSANWIPSPTMCNCHSTPAQLVLDGACNSVNHHVFLCSRLSVLNFNFFFIYFSNCFLFRGLAFWVFMITCLILFQTFFKSNISG